MFAPGSHCFAIDILYISVYIKQICDLPSPLLIDLNCSSQIFNLQKLGRQQSNCSKTGPQKIKPEEKNQSSTFPTGLSNVFFPHFFHMFILFHSHFFPSAFSKRIFFTFFFPSAFSKRIFSACFSHFCEQM